MNAPQTRGVLIVPDEQHWAAWGQDTTSLTPAVSPASTRVLLCPDRVPEGLHRALGRWLGDAPAGLTVHSPTAGATAGPRLRDVVARAARGDVTPAPEEDGHHGHEEEHDDHDMMAIIGDPSADGLVMEDIDLTLGPLGPPLPAGVTAQITLDGDVVAACRVARTLAGVGGDPLTPAARATRNEQARASAATSGPERWGLIATVERERALSHAAWLRALGRLLDHGRLVAAAGAVIRTLHAGTPDGRDAVGCLSRLVAADRPLRRRLAGVGTVSSGDAAAARGPVARACGLNDDVRSGDPAYAHLGFQPVLAHTAGDALARTLVRAGEALQAVVLAAAAASAARAGTVCPPPSAATVEGPRGPLGAGDHAAAATADLAAAAALGAEWSAALATLVSFDLSGWAATA